MAGVALTAWPLAAQNNKVAQNNTAASKPAAPAKKAAGPPTLLAYLQLAPLAALAKDIMAVAREFAPGQQTEMTPVALLGRFGYPDFPGVSDQVPMFVLIFDYKDDDDVVIGAQISFDSPVLAALMGLKVPMVKDEATGWTFFSDDPDLLAYAHDHAETYAKSAGLPMSDDLLVTLPTTDLKLVTLSFPSFFHITPPENGKKGNVSFGLAVNSTAKDADKDKNGPAPADDKWMDFAVRELQQLRLMQLGLDLRADNIRLTFSATAKPGTLAAQFLSAPAGGDVPAAKYVPADAPIFLAMHENVPALKALTSGVFTDAEAIAGPKGQPVIADLQKAMALYYAQTDGTGAETFNLTNLQSQGLYGGNVTDATMVQFMQMYPGIKSGLLHNVNSTLGSLLLTNITLNLNAGKVSDVPVHDLVTKESFNPAYPAGTPAQQQTYKELMENESSTGHLYFAAVNGYYATASSLKDLGGLVGAVQSGRSAPNSVASVITLAPGQFTAGQFNLQQLYLEAYNNNDKKKSAAAVAAIVSLRNVKLPPITFTGTTGSGQGQFEIDMPVATLVKMLQTSRAQGAPAAPAASSSNAPARTMGAAGGGGAVAPGGGVMRAP
jgi:hypothetical protein